MNEPTQEEAYRLCGIEQPEWSVDWSLEGSRNAGRGKEPFGAVVALRWIALLGGRAYQRTSAGLFDVYESSGSVLRIRIG